MSTTSSATASGRDCDVPSALKLFLKLNCALHCSTRRDGTPMDASSVTEEDIIEICITKGHTHPLGVLHYSATDTELVVLFHLTDELQCTAHRIMKATELWAEAITVKAMAPSEAHTKAYLVTLHLNPSNGEGELHIHLLNKLPQAGECHIVFNCRSWRPCWPWPASAHGRS